MNNEPKPTMIELTKEQIAKIDEIIAAGPRVTKAMQEYINQRKNNREDQND